MILSFLICFFQYYSMPSSSNWKTFISFTVIYWHKQSVVSCRRTFVANCVTSRKVVLIFVLPCSLINPTNWKVCFKTTMNNPCIDWFQYVHKPTSDWVTKIIDHVLMTRLTCSHSAGQINEMMRWWKKPQHHFYEILEALVRIISWCNFKFLDYLLWCWP